MTNEERRLLREHCAFGPATRAELKTRLDALRPGDKYEIGLRKFPHQWSNVRVTLEDFNIAIAELTLLGKL